MRAPSIFLSHGGPNLAVEASPTAEFLAQLGSSLKDARAVLSISAHWQESRPTASVAEKPATIHDFGGFGPELMTMQYPAPGEPAVARKAADLLRRAGFDATLDPRRGFDHGTWVPLKRMFPNADMPVATVSILDSLDPEAHLAMGVALRPLRDEGIVVLGSGGAVHPLGVPGLRPTPSAHPAAVAFDDWLVDAAQRGDRDSLLHFRQAPGASFAQFYPDHFMPLLVALGAGGPGAKAKVLHREMMMGIFTLTSFEFDAAS
ncbi:MAG: DODA-type extradiol aromatic ring-opening family dioxygenase [Thermoplasmatota archaeon]